MPFSPLATHRSPKERGMVTEHFTRLLGIIADALDQTKQTRNDLRIVLVECLNLFVGEARSGCR